MRSLLIFLFLMMVPMAAQASDLCFAKNAGCLSKARGDTDGYWAFDPNTSKALNRSKGLSMLCFQTDMKFLDNNDVILPSSTDSNASKCIETAKGPLRWSIKLDPARSQARLVISSGEQSRDFAARIQASPDGPVLSLSTDIPEVGTGVYVLYYAWKPSDG